MAVLAQRRLRARDLAFGMRFTVVVSHQRVTCEVIYVRPRAIFGDRRIVLRRVDTGIVLAQARALSDLSPVEA